MPITGKISVLQIKAIVRDFPRDVIHSLISPSFFSKKVQIVTQEGAFMYMFMCKIFFALRSKEIY